MREALITAQLEHPGIVPVHDAGRWPSGEPYYSMKLVTGRTLRDLIQTRTGFAERMALVPNVLAVAEAIAHAHSRDVIHRDIKPPNVLVGDFGETVGIDWGLAKDLSGRVAEPAVPVGADGTVRLWPLAALPDDRPAAIPARLRDATSAALDGEGRPYTPSLRRGRITARAPSARPGRTSAPGRTGPAPRRARPRGRPASGPAAPAGRAGGRPAGRGCRPPRRR